MEPLFNSYDDKISELINENNKNKVCYFLNPNDIIININSINFESHGYILIFFN